MCIRDSDQMVAPAMKGAMGNCYAQLGQLDKASSMLLKAADEADNNTPVSYTHLDVYKRQGIKRVVYSEKYRLEDGIELLKRAGIEVIYMSIES